MVKEVWDRYALHLDPQTAKKNKAKGALLLALETCETSNYSYYKRNKKKKEEDINKARRARRASRIPCEEETSLEVHEILNDIERQELQRRQDAIAAQLAAIQQRIEMALGSSYDSPQDDLQPVPEDQVSTTFDIKKKKQQLLYERRLLFMIADFEASSGVQNTLLIEVNKWFEYVIPELQNDLREDGVEEDDQATVMTESGMVQSAKLVKEALKHAEDMCKKIGRINKTLMQKAGCSDYGDSDKRQPQAGGNPVGGAKKAEKTEIYNEKSLLADRLNFDSAMHDVNEVLNQAIRQVRSNKEKMVMRNAGKQQKFLIKAMEHRHMELDAAQEEILKLKMTIEQLANAKERLTDENNNLTSQVDARDAHIISLKAVEQKYKDSVNKKSASTGRIPDEKSATFLKVPSHVGLKPQRSNTRNKSVDAVNADKLRAELEQCRTELAQESKRCGQMETSLREKEEQTTQLEAKMDVQQQQLAEHNAMETRRNQEFKFKMKSISEQNDSLECLVARLRSELNCKDELIEFQERRLLDMRDDVGSITGRSAEDSGFYSDDRSSSDKRSEVSGSISVKPKEINGRMEKEFNMEISRLKNFLEKEKLRGEANMRRVEQTHKDQLQMVHKQSLHLLRSINRFKGSIVQILEREQLPAAANDVKCMPDMPTEEAPNDTRLLLAQMAENAVQLLVSMEFKLSQALMNKRLEVKDNTIARSFAAKDLENQMETAFKAKQLAESLTEKLRDAKQKLQQNEEALKNIHKLEGDKLKVLSLRYKQLWTNASSLQKEMAALQRDFGETVKNKDKNIKSLLDNKRNASKTLEHTQAALALVTEHALQRRSEKEKSFQLSAKDIEDNVGMLTALYQRNQITQQVYETAMSLSHQMQDIPDLRMQQLFSRYIAHRRLHDIKEDIHQTMEENKMDPSALEKHLQNADRKIQQTSQVWQMKRDKLESDKRTLFQRMADIFSDLASDGTLLMLTAIPALPSIPHANSIYPSVCGDHRRGSMFVHSRRGTFVPPIEPPRVPSGLIGQTLPIIGEKEKMWHLPTIAAPLAPGAINTPTILDLDINRRKYAAARALQRIRPSMEMPQVEGFDYQESVLRPLRELMGTQTNIHVDVPTGRPLTPTRLLEKKSSELFYYVN